MAKDQKELKEALSFICALANSIGDVAEDGKVTLKDVTYLVQLLYKIPSAVDGMADIPSEVSEMDEEAIAALGQMVKNELDLPQDKIEQAIEDGIDICLRLYALALKMKA